MSSDLELSQLTKDGASSTSQLKDSVLYGRTQDGRTFAVPETRDMINTLFITPYQRTSLTMFTLGILGLEIGLFFILPAAYCQYIFLLLFLSWRVGYNGFLGYLLYRQSNGKYWVRLLNRHGFLDDKMPWGKWWRDQLTRSMGPDYHFDKVPPEFNAWLLYRQVVDLILVNDFTTYILFSLAHFNSRWSDWAIWENGLRYLTALLLIAFNLAVKVDAHRVVKDFAWYWGDFFFLIDQELTFDGVFELAPHPMYSLGYAGYYGISLFTASTTVFYTSLLAHAAQFVFLVVVENPHIEKTYPSPSQQQEDQKLEEVLRKRNIHLAYTQPNLMKFLNFDPHRATDLFSLVLIGYAIITPLVGYLPSGWLGTVLIGQALGWRLAHTLGLGFFVLGPQSQNKNWTRHFIKSGGTPEEAFSNWQSIYNLSGIMTYITYIVAAVHFYQGDSSSLGGGWANSTIRHTFGLLLVALHLWTSISVLDVLGTFGWFYGDFFLDPPPLVYTGIYRYLNNPEKIIGQAALYGIALISGSAYLFALALVSHTAYLILYYGVEAPHMKSRYKGQLRREAGVSKTVRAAAQSLTVTLAGERALLAIQRAESLVDKVGEKMDAAFSKVQSRVPALVKDTNQLIATTKHRLSETRDRLVQDLIDHTSSNRISNPSNISDQETYSMKVLGFDSDQPPRVELGQALRIRITTPSRCKLGWVGIYSTSSNPSKVITTVSSKGRYLYTHPSAHEVEYEEDVPTRDPSQDSLYSEMNLAGNYEVTLTFSGDLLPWKPGTYEFRMYKDMGHTVASLSHHIDITNPLPLQGHFTEADLIKSDLLPYAQRCSMATSTNPEKVEDLGNWTRPMAQKLTQLILARYTVEFLPEVLLAHSNWDSLCQRILDARAALAPAKQLA